MDSFFRSNGSMLVGLERRAAILPLRALDEVAGAVTFVGERVHALGIHGDLLTK